MTHGCPECGSMGGWDPCTCPPPKPYKKVEKVSLFGHDDSNHELGYDESDAKVDEYLNNVKSGEFRFFEDKNWFTYKALGYLFLGDAFHALLKKTEEFPSEDKDSSTSYEVSYIDTHGNLVRKRIWVEAECRWSDRIEEDRDYSDRYKAKTSLHGGGQRND